MPAVGSRDREAARISTDNDDGRADTARPLSIALMCERSLSEMRTPCGILRLLPVTPLGVARMPAAAGDDSSRCSTRSSCCRSSAISKSFFANACSPHRKLSYNHAEPTELLLLHCCSRNTRRSLSATAMNPPRTCCHGGSAEPSAILLLFRQCSVHTVETGIGSSDRRGSCCRLYFFRLTRSSSTGGTQ